MVKYLDNNSGFNQWNASRNAAAKKSGMGGFFWWLSILVCVWFAITLFRTPKNTVDAADSVSPEMDLSAVAKTEISSDKISATVQGLRIYDVRLMDFAASSDTKNSERVSLLSGDGDYAEFGYVASSAAPAPTSNWKSNGDTYTWRSPDGILFTRTITVDNYVITVSDEIKNNSKSDASFAPYARIVRGNDVTSSAGVKTGGIAYVNSDVEYDAWNKLNKKSFAYSTVNGFAGFVDQYWETVASITRPDQTIRLKGAAGKYTADAAADAVLIPAGASENVVTNIYAGPRAQRELSAAATKIAGIDKTIDYGWFWFLARPMLWILNMLNSLVHSYGIAIIILTLLLRFAIWPLTRKSYTSMMAMQKMQPEMQRIQKLYANDKPRMQMEMMRLYQTHKTSPMSGCLPMLLQIPIFFALYKALLVSVQMRNAHFLWIPDLAAMDPYFILPILMGLTMWLQSRLQSGANKEITNDAVAQTQKVMKWMPVFFTIMFAWMPAGLVLYWTVSNLFGIVQMYVIKHQSK